MDFTAGGVSPEGEKALAFAIATNRSGNPEEAIKKARMATRGFAAAGNPAAAVRSRLEEVYALRRQSKGQTCAQEAREGYRDANARRYTWLIVQFGIELSVCDAMVSRFGLAWLEASQAEKQARRINYSSLVLRALALESSLSSAEGRYGDAWAVDQEGLNIFWNSQCSPERGFQFYSDLELASEAAHKWPLAAALEREAIAWINKTDRVDFKALAHLQLGTDLLKSGESEDGRKALGDAHTLFNTLPDNQTTRFYRSLVDVALSSIELDKGNLRVAHTLLERVGRNLDNVNNFVVQLPYEKTWARLDAALGNNRDRERHLLSAIQIAGRGFISLTSENDRWMWRNEVGPVYREFLDIQFRKVHQPKDALEAWYKYRTLELLGPNVAPYSPLQTKKMHKSSLVTFATLPGKVVVWVADDRGIEESWIAAPPQDVQQSATRFYRLCSNPTSSLEKVNAEGTRLYQMLIAPIQQLLDSKRTIVIDADEHLGTVIWPALRSSNGEYFGQAYNIANTVGPPELSTPAQVRHPDAQRLVIMEPGTVVWRNQKFLRLEAAGEEVSSVSTLYPDKTVLRDRHATVVDLRKALIGASVFHFVGHADTTDIGGELVVNTADGGGDAIEASTLGTLALTNLQLVVLSSCSTSSQLDSPERDPRGLIRAFVKSGAHTIVSSKWNVDSASTTEMMIHFHRAYRSGINPEEALRRAESEVQRQHAYAHPYFWSSFQVFESGSR